MPLLVSAPVPAISPPYVRATPGLVDTVAAPVRAMPRLESRVNDPLARRVAAAIVRWPDVGAPGAVPRALSPLMFSVPAVTVVAPSYVLEPDSTSVPVPTFVRLPGPAISPP